MVLRRNLAGPPADGRSRRRRRRLRGGGVMLSVLTFVPVVGVVLACIGALVTSHVIRGRAEADYARAIAFAEAGANHELNWISGDPTNPNRAHQLVPGPGQPGPATINIPGGGTATVGVTASAGGAWSPGSTVRIVSTGRSGDVRRTIEVLGEPVGTFAPQFTLDQFAVFGIQSVSFSGSGSSATGSVGSNGTITATAGASAVNGPIVYCGSTPTLTGPNVYRQPNPYLWPTVPTMALQFKSTGMVAWKTQNNNDQLKKFHPTNGRYLLGEAVAAGYTKSDWVLTGSSFGKTPALTQDGHNGDKPGGGRYSNATDGLYGKDVLIFPPGDYYFETISLTSTKHALLVDNASGPVRIWIGGSDSGGDKIHVTTLLTDPNDPASFRVLYAKPGELSITGTTHVSGVYYVLDGSAQSSLKLSGNSNLTGAIVSNVVTITGNSTTGYPNARYPFYFGLSAPTDPPRSYRFSQTWKEISTNGSTVYADGTPY
ncbi:MAG: hypothetical protein KIS66_14210 [Fimbriimonadaceae bacterium]|nr:hypothetical protein [Fimbriimonadaceae bacterium]